MESISSLYGIKIIAHGGYSAKYPENTEQSYLEAVKFKPDILEMDVILHPQTQTLRCFHPAGVSSQEGIFYDNNELAQIIRGQDLPELSKMALKIPTSIKLLLDFKQPSQEVFVNALNNPSFNAARCILGIRNYKDLDVVKSMNSQVETLALFTNPNDYESYKHQGGKYFRLWEKDVDATRVKRIQAAGLEVWVTPGHKATKDMPRTAGNLTPETLEYLLNMAVDAIFVNDLEFVKNYLRRR